MANVPHARPSSVTAEKGEVLVDGPNGVAVAMTPDAAEETARRLTTAAGEARDQARHLERPRRAG